MTNEGPRSVTDSGDPRGRLQRGPTGRFSTRGRGCLLLYCGTLVVLGILLLVRSAYDAGREHRVDVTVIASGCTVSVRPTQGAAPTSFRVGLCPSIPVGSRVTVVYDGDQPINLLVGTESIDLATGKVSKEKGLGILTVLLGGGMLVIFGLASAPPLRRLPRPTLGGFAIFGSEVALPAAFGLIGSQRPLQEESVGAEVVGTLGGATLGLILAVLTGWLFRRRLFLRGESDRPDRAIG